MTIRALRISKTSIQGWSLHGPVDQALKTSIQADAVRFCPINIVLHGEPVEMELWVNAVEVDEDTSEAPNPYAMVMLQVQKLKDAGQEPTKTIEVGPFTIGLTDMGSVGEQPMIVGPAVLTGAGGTDVPDHSVHCIFAALMGHEAAPLDDM